MKKIAKIFTITFLTLTIFLFASTAVYAYGEYSRDTNDFDLYSESSCHKRYQQLGIIN